MSAATLALCLKMPAISLSETPASGCTIDAHDDALRLRPFSGNICQFLVRTWTKSVSASAAVTSTDYGVTLGRLRDLLSDEDEEERPSQEAYERAVYLLRESARLVGLQFPSAKVAAGPSRSVRLLWSGNEKEVRLVIGGAATNRSYIYWRLADNSGVDEKLDVSRVAEYLNWVVQDA